MILQNVEANKAEDAVLVRGLGRHEAGAEVRPRPIFQLFIRQIGGQMQPIVSRCESIDMGFNCFFKIIDFLLPHKVVKSSENCAYVNSY